MAGTRVCWLLLMLSLYALLSVEGARRINLEKRLTERMTHYSSPLVRRALEGREPSAKDMLGLHGDEHLEERQHIVTASGTTKIKLQETYLGLLVDGETLVVEKDTQGHFTGSVSGRLVEDLEQDIGTATPSLSSMEALYIALNSRGDNEEDIEFDPDRDVKLEVYIDHEDPTTSEDVDAKLVYKVSYLRRGSNGMPSKPTFLIDAHTGDIYQSWDAIAHSGRKGKLFEMTGIGGNEKSGMHIYGKDLPHLQLYREGNTCFLENDKARVIHLYHELTWGAGPNVTLNNTTFSFDCNEGFDDSINGGYSPMTDAFYFSNAVYDMFTRWYDVPPLESKIAANIHVGEGFNNAFWWDDFVNFGDGNGSYYPWVTLDIMGHEIGHGFTEQNSGLIYRGQSGAMNEAFSDMAGATVVSFVYGEADYRVAFNIKRAEEEALRYMYDPEKDGHSIGHYEQYCPGTDVHYTSGVFNKAFYELANMPGWSARTAFEVFVLANRIYWFSDSMYSDGACGAIRAASDLAFSVEDVRNAFKRVGIEPCIRNRNRIDLLHNLRAKKGQEIQFVFELQKRMKELRFETFSRSYSNDVDLYVKSYRHKLSSANNETLDETITIENALPGPYVVTLKAAENFMSVSLYAIESEVIMMRNISVSTPSKDRYRTDVEFYFPEQVQGSPIAVRVNPRVSFFASFNATSDLENYVLDFWGNWKTNMSEILICHVKPGPYIFTLTTSEETYGFDMSYVSTLIPDRVVYPRQFEKK